MKTDYATAVLAFLVSATIIIGAVLVYQTLGHNTTYWQVNRADKSDSLTAE